MTQKEKTQVTDKIVKWVNTIPGCLARKRHLSQYGVGGDPDIYGSIAGWHFEIEAKLPGNDATERQEFRLREWKNAGATVGVAHSLEEAQTILAPILIRLGLVSHLPETLRP